jgi:hypothetical protein
MLHPAQQRRADRPYLSVPGSQGGVLLAQAAASQGKLLAKAIACAQHVDNVICRSQARLASLWASRRLTSADLRQRRLERAQLALAALAELRRSASSGDTRKAFEASFKQPPTYLREQEVLRHLRALDRLDVQARYVATL